VLRLHRIILLDLDICPSVQRCYAWHDKGSKFPIAAVRHLATLTHYIQSHCIARKSFIITTTSFEPSGRYIYVGPKSSEEEIWQPEVLRQTDLGVRSTQQNVFAGD
jgi:hypothetical protein